MEICNKTTAQLFLWNADNACRTYIFIGSAVTRPKIDQINTFSLETIEAQHILYVLLLS